tara:strand:+ start:1079 stop:1921 length:843 start_codon:yes stop_codon:yes gene_type:complete
MQKNQILKSSLKNRIKYFDEKYFFSIILKVYNFLRKFNKRKYNIKPISKEYGFYINDYLKKNNYLTMLCEKYNSDKGGKKNPFSDASNNYTDYYYKIFKDKRNSYKKIFECGLGSNNPNLESNMTSSGSPGASLKVWKEFFPNAKIYGADVDRDSLFNEDRIYTFYVDQYNKLSIEAMWSEIKEIEFDLIIDDGAHYYDANINFFENSFHKLKNNGLYIIEDIRLSEIHKFYDYFRKSSNDVEFISMNSNSSDGSSNLIVIHKSDKLVAGDGFEPPTSRL